ncbi:MAG: cobalt-precorrin-6A reductase [Roseiarcus sp.]
MRVLILGGSHEATRLAARLAEEPAFAPILSLAGRTRNPSASPIPSRIGGFGGAAGLAAFLRSGSFGALVDATHPFAERMSANAVAATRETGTPLVVFSRPPWTPRPGDRWTESPDAESAARAIGAAPRRVFLTVGRLQLPAFEAAPQHEYLIRTIDPPQSPRDLPRHRLLLARGPFTFEDEARLMRAEKIEVLVAKNSGGDSTSAKLDAARSLGLEMILVRRPAPPEALTLHSLDDVMRLLRACLHCAAP